MSRDFECGEMLFETFGLQQGCEAGEVLLVTRRQFEGFHSNVDLCFLYLENTRQSS